MSCTQIIVTVISIVLSGFFSWLMTFIYFKITNRNAALSSVVEEIINIINNGVNKKSIKELKIIIYRFEFRYLRSKEREIIKDLFYSLKKAVAKSEFEVDCSILTNYFDDIIEKYGIDKFVYEEYDPINDAEILLPPPEYDHLYESIKNELDACYDLYSSRDYEYCKLLEKNINCVYNYYLTKVFFHKKTINFFENISIDKLLNTDERKIEWNNKWIEYNNCKKMFEKKFEKVYKKRQNTYE